MEFTVSRNALLQALTHARCIISKGPLELFSNFVFTFPDNEKNSLMTINASNGEYWFSETISIIPNPSPADSPAGFRPFSVHHLDIVRPVRTLEEQPLLIKVCEYQLSVHHACGSFRIPLANNASEFLSIPRLTPDAEAADGHLFEYEAPGLRSILDRCCFAMAKDELRPVMNGVYMNCTAEYTDYVSSDGHKLVRVRKSHFDNVTAKDLSFIIPARVVRILLRILPRTGDVDLVYQAALMRKETKLVKGKFEDSYVCERKAAASVIIDGNATLTFCTIDGKYPRYWSVIPGWHDLEMVIDRRPFFKSVQRLSLFSNPTSGLTMIACQENEMTIRTKDNDFMLEGEEKLPCECRKDNGGTMTPFRFALRDTSLAETLKALPSDKVQFDIIDETRAIIIKPVPQPDVEDITMLLMPMLTNESDWV